MKAISRIEVGCYQAVQWRRELTEIEEIYEGAHENPSRCAKGNWKHHYICPHERADINVVPTLELHKQRTSPPWPGSGVHVCNASCLKNAASSWKHIDVHESYHSAILEQLPEELVPVIQPVPCRCRSSRDFGAPAYARLVTLSNIVGVLSAGTACTNAWVHPLPSQGKFDRCLRRDLPSPREVEGTHHQVPTSIAKVTEHEQPLAVRRRSNSDNLIV